MNKSDKKTIGDISGVALDESNTLNMFAEVFGAFVDAGGITLYSGSCRAIQKVCHAMDPDPS